MGHFPSRSLVPIQPWSQMAPLRLLNGLWNLFPSRSVAPSLGGIVQWDTELFPFRSLVSDLSVSDQNAVADSHFLTYVKCAGVCSPVPSSSDKNH